MNSLTCVIKCSGNTPCDACASRNSECRYDQSADQRRKIANQRNIQDLVEAQASLEAHRHLLGGIIATLRAGNTSATDELLITIRSGVDLSQLAAHVRNARRADRAIEEAFSAIKFEIDSPTNLIDVSGRRQSLHNYSHSSSESVPQISEQKVPSLSEVFGTNHIHDP